MTRIRDLKFKKLLGGSQYGWNQDNWHGKFSSQGQLILIAEVFSFGRRRKHLEMWKYKVLKKGPPVHHVFGIFDIIQFFLETSPR